MIKISYSYHINEGENIKYNILNSYILYENCQFDESYFTLIKYYYMTVREILLINIIVLVSKHQKCIEIQLNERSKVKIVSEKFLTRLNSSYTKSPFIRYVTF